MLGARPHSAELPVEENHRKKEYPLVAQAVTHFPARGITMVMARV